MSEARARNENGLPTLVSGKPLNCVVAKGK
jgi:hypothetical protein